MKHLIGLSMALTLLVTAGGVGMSVYYLYFQQQEVALKKATVASGDGTAAVGRISELIDVPGNEVPTVAVIKGIEETQSQPGLAMAKPGDVVLVYAASNRVYIYDPVREKLRNAGPLLLPTPEPQANAGEVAGVAVESIPVAIVASKGQENELVLVKKQLATFTPKVSVSVELPILKKDFAQSQVVDLTGDNADLVKNLAQTLGGRVGTLQKEDIQALKDQAEDAQVLVIVGMPAEVTTPTPTIIP